MAGQDGEKRATETREHLANERTLLAWVRTGVGLISLGIVVERAGTLTKISGGRDAEISTFLGVAMAVLGCLTLLMGTWQFLRNRRQISRGDFLPTARTYLIVVTGSLVLGGLFVVYVVFAL